MNVTTRFLKDEDVEGIRLYESNGTVDMVYKLKCEIGNRCYGNSKQFPGNTPVPLLEKKRGICHLAHPFNEPYVMSPKPLGVRYLLYADKHGDMFMENENQHIFKLDRGRTPQLIPKETVLDGVVARKLERDGAALNNSGEAQGKLTFVIMDATLVGSEDVAMMPLENRMKCVQTHIMEPRSKATDMDGRNVVLDIDVARYEPLSYMEYLEPTFKDYYKYTIGSFIFKPTIERYHRGYKKGKPVLEWDMGSCEELSFRLKVVSDEGHTSGHLYAIGPNPEGEEVRAGAIDLTAELRTLNGRVIECQKINGRWVFVRVRNDREHPNVHLSKYGEIVAPASLDYLRDALRLRMRNKN